MFTPKSISGRQWNFYGIARLATTLLVAFLVLTPLKAQRDVLGQWENGCDQDASPVLAEYMGEATHALGCEVYFACLANLPPYVAGVIYCELPVYEAFLNACTDDAALCNAKAGLYTMAITIFTVSYSEFPFDFTYAIPNILYQFNYGGEGYQYAVESVEEMIASLQQVAYARLYLTAKPNIFVMSGVLYQYLGMNAEALEAYTNGQLFFGETPLLYYLRAQLYAEMGKLDLAAIDALQLDLMTARFPPVTGVTTLSPATGVTSLSRDYPLDMSRLTEWSVYPVYSHVWTKYGDSVLDRTILESTTTRLGFYDDGVTLLWVEGEGDETVVISLKRRAENIYSGVAWANFGSMTNLYRGAEDPAIYGMMIVTFDGDLARVDKHLQGYEVLGLETSLLTTPQASDPRIDRYQRCEGGARWRLNIGGRANVNNLYTPPPLYVILGAGPTDKGVLWWIRIVG